MDYEQKYNEALERARECMKDGGISQNTIDYLCNIFPELTESEDEKIRKALIEYFNEQCDMSDWNGVYGYQVVAWLEKQGEQKSVDKVKPRFEVGDKVYEVIDGFECTIESIDETTYYGDTTNFDIKDQDKWELVEQKPANKLEPKFKVGDWITRVIDKPCQIISISDTGNYIVVRYCDNEKTHILSKNFCESNFHLWTINDAEDGDVLTVDGISFIYCCDGNYQCNYQGNVTPANKKQRDAFFAKAKEAGYEWDAEKKRFI